MNLPKIALAGGLLLGGAALVPAPVAAQYGSGSQQAEEQAAQGERGTRQDRRRRGRQSEQPAGPQLTAEESPAIAPLVTAVQARNWAAAQAALPAAQAGAVSPYGKYVVGRLQLELGQGTQNAQMQQQAVEAMLASNNVPPEALNTLLGARASFAITAENWPVAEESLTRLLATDPNNTQRLYELGEVKIYLNKHAEALALYQRLLQAREATGQKAPEAQYKRALLLARQVRSAEAITQLSRSLLTHYPTAENWREALTVYRSSAGSEADLALDLRRLMRTAQAFGRDADYIEFADRLIRVGQLGEAKAVLDEGISRNLLQADNATVRALMTSANSRIAEDRASLPAMRSRGLAAASGREARIAADAYLGYGQFSEAVALYRAALQKGGENADMVNMRLGIALAQSGQRAEAETAFRAVTGPRTELANYWLLWLARTTG